MGIYNYVCFNRLKGMKKTSFKDLQIGSSFYCKESSEWYRKIDSRTAVLLKNKFKYDVSADSVVYISDIQGGVR